MIEIGSHPNIGTQNATIADLLSKQPEREQQLVLENYHLFLDAFLAWKFEHAHLLSTSNAGKGSVLNPSFLQLLQQVEQTQVSLNQFEFCKLLSRGAFGEVFLVRERCGGKYYAIKVLKKLNMLNQRETAFFMEECEIMQKAARSQWLMKSECVFQDAYNLYFVMEYYASGDLMGLLCRQECGFSESQVQFYAAELVLAIEELHGMGFVHRDIKPDNLLIDKQGHVKLIDFGSCGRLVDGKIASRSTVGTPDYISPEVLLTKEDGSEPYGTECDIWSFGTVFYELLFGDPPFLSDSLMQTYSAIINHRESLKFPENVAISSDAKDLIVNVITDKSNRLTLKQIKRHPFFQNINWQNMKSVTPPIVPPNLTEGDTSAFEDTSSKEIMISRVKIPPGSQSYFIGCTTSMARETSFRSSKDDYKKGKTDLKPSNDLAFYQMESSMEKLPDNGLKANLKSGVCSHTGSNMIAYANYTNLSKSQSIFDFTKISSHSISLERSLVLAKSKSSLLSDTKASPASLSNSLSSLLNRSVSSNSVLNNDKKSYKLLQQEYKALEQRFNLEVIRRQELEEELSALQSQSVDNSGGTKEIPVYLMETLVLGEFSCTDFLPPNQSQKSNDFFGLFRKHVAVHLKGGKLIVTNKQKSKASGNIDFLFDLCDDSLMMRTTKRDGQYLIELIKNPRFNSPTSHFLSHHDAQIRLTKAIEMLRKEEMIQKTLQEMLPLMPDSKSRTQTQEELRLSQIRAFFVQQEQAKLLKTNYREKIVPLDFVPTIIDQFNGHSFAARLASTASMLTLTGKEPLERGKSRTNDEWECTVCGKFLLHSSAQKPGKLLYTCNACGCKCHADCIAFLPLSCTEYSDYVSKESFFVLATKSKETFAKWSHLIDLSIKIQI